MFFSRWPAETHPGGWLTHSEIAHAIAENPEGPYEVLGPVLQGRGKGHWDAVTIHNPTIHKVGNQYALFYIGNSDGSVDTQRVGLAMSSSLFGPWERIGNTPLVDISRDKSKWDSYITTNPAFLKHPNGQCWLYYRTWDRHNDNLRKVGLAIADQVTGPYRKHPENPLVDFSAKRAKVIREVVEGNQVEDPYVFMDNNEFHMLLKDFGMIDHRSGLHLRSSDGIHWDHERLMIGYRRSNYYFKGPTHRFERPQLLMRNKQPEYLFLGLRGGKGPGSGAVLKVRPKPTS